MAAPSADPFFDKPYEPTGSGEAAWEQADKAAVTSLATATTGGNRASPNIRPKKKVAALLGGSSR